MFCVCVCVVSVRVCVCVCVRACVFVCACACVRGRSIWKKCGREKQAETKILGSFFCSINCSTVPSEQTPGNTPGTFDEKVEILGVISSPAHHRYSSTSHITHCVYYCVKCVHYRTLIIHRCTKHINTHKYVYMHSLIRLKP